MDVRDDPRGRLTAGRAAPAGDRGGAEALADALLRWLNLRLAPPERAIERDTPLFEGLIDSIRILEIIAWVERAIGAPIPDREIRMDRFGSVERIARNFFGPAPGEVVAPGDPLVFGDAVVPDDTSASGPAGEPRYVDG